MVTHWPVQRVRIGLPLETRTNTYNASHSKLDLLEQHLLSGKLPHELEWSDAVGLIEKVGQVQVRAANEFTLRSVIRRNYSGGPAVARWAWPMCRD